MNVRELMAKRAEVLGQARSLLDKADAEQRQLTAEEETQYQAAMGTADQTEDEIKRRSKLEQAEAELAQTPEHGRVNPVVSNFNRKTRLGDNEARATAYYIRTGDRAALRGLESRGDEFTADLYAASNDTDMNIGTPGDGGVAVPTGHYQGIIAKRNEGALFGPLGVLPIPGVGLTVNVPFESGVANEFVTASEVGNFDRDAPALNAAAMTLVKKTKNVELSVELLNAEDSQLLAYLDNYVGRALAKTHNSALVTEALANGTSVALGAAAAATAGDPETVIYTLAGEYGDNANWIMKRATEGAYKKLTGSAFLYQNTPNGADRSLGGFPMWNSEYVAAIGAGNKSSIFGDFGYMGMRESGLTFLRNPYLKASTGQVILHYYVQVVYKVLNAEAILYGRHPTA